ncbi:MAG: hypothetical protein IJS29_07590 [Selenomonadaceae bacterium]|nr:hypothetical protein [Selenomonadaceae bacterium]
MAMFNKSNVKLCISCGNPFVPQNDEDFCFRCRNSDSAKEAEIMDYMRNNPGTSIMEISRQTNLPKGTLLNMAHEGRFEGFSLGKDLGKPCAVCGKLITVGTYCPSCFEHLKKDSKNRGNINAARARVAAQSKDDEIVTRTFSSGMQDEINSRRRKR